MESLYKQVYETYSTTLYTTSNYLPSKEELSTATYNSKIWDIKNADNKYPYFKYDSSSIDKEDFIANYGNPLAAISVFRITYVIDKFEDKISLKLYVFDKTRRAGKYYTQTNSIVHFITYKFKTNEFYFGMIGKKNKRITARSVRKNYFGGMNPPFNKLMSHFTQYILPHKRIGNEIIAAEVFHDSFSVFIKNIPGFSLNKPFNYSNMDAYFYENYLIKNNIKYSNNFLSFIDKTPKPSKRIIKKCNNKFIDAFMYVNKLRGDKIKKILHTSEVINEYFYKNVLCLFGEDFIKEQSYDDLKSIFNYSSGYSAQNIKLEISKSEKKRAFSTLVDMVRNNNSFNTYIDHVSFYISLNKYEKIKWKSVDALSFHHEHMEWSEKLQYYRQGLYTREYNQEFISEVEAPIFDNYYPIVFTKSKEYTDESATQNNCVKTYINRAPSLIISVRYGGLESTDRATIEYQITKDKTTESLKIKRTQSLGKYNQKLEEKWEAVLKLLDIRINNLVKTKKFTLPKLTIENTLKKIKSGSTFVNNVLMWENSEVMYFYQYELDAITVEF